MGAAVGRSVMAFGAGIALSAAFFSIRASHPSETAPMPPVVPLGDLCAFPERYVGKEVAVSGRLASEIQLEYCEQIGAEWWPLFDTTSNTVHTQRLEYIRPIPLGYWWRMHDPGQGGAAILVFTPEAAERDWQPSTDSDRLISFSARARIRVDGTPYLEAIVTQDSQPAQAPLSRRGTDDARYVIPFDPLEGWISSARELEADPKAPPVTVQELHTDPKRYQGSSVTLVGSPQFLGVEAHTSRRLQGLARFQTAEQLSPASVEQSRPEHMRSAPIVVAGVWYQVASGSTRVLILSEEGSLPINTTALRGQVSYHADGTPLLVAEAYGTRELR